MKFAASETVLEVNRVSKSYARRPKITRTRLASLLGRAMSGMRYQPLTTLRETEFWAVRNVSFSLKRGEALGIMGLNGSGKTTLLRMLAGQILPDDGEIRILGTSAAMIDLTAGFETAASGQENIFLRGAALGRSRKEMEQGFGDIVDFAELGDAIFAPVVTYSSGMIMRLAFSIMVAARPEVLLIDEILAVGDFRFRQKCLAKIREMRDHTAIVLVSHNTVDVSRFCDRAVVLNKGQVVFEGKPEPAIAHYSEIDTETSRGSNRHNPHLLLKINRSELISDIRVFWSDEGGAQMDNLYEGDPLFLDIQFTILYKPTKLLVGIPVFQDGSDIVCGFSTDGKTEIGLSANENIHLRLCIPEVALNPGHYVACISISDGVEFLYRNRLPDLFVRSKGRLSWGVVTISHEWKVLD